MKIKNIYIIGDYGPEHYMIYKIVDSYEKALQYFQEHRMALLNKVIAMRDYWEKVNGKQSGYSSLDMYNEMIENLTNENPETIENYPQETPFIHKYELEVTE